MDLIWDEENWDEEEFYAEDYDVDLPPSVEILWPPIDFESIPF